MFVPSVTKKTNLLLPSNEENKEAGFSNEGNGTSLDNDEDVDV